MRNSLFIFLCIVGFNSLSAQSAEVGKYKEQFLRNYTSQYYQELGISQEDANSAFIADSYKDAKTGILHAYLHQFVDGMPVLNAVLGLHFDKNEKLLHAANSFVKYENANLSPSAAFGSLVFNAARYVQMQFDSANFQKLNPKARNSFDENGKYYYDCWYHSDNKLLKATNVIVYNPATSDWWNIIVSSNGDVLNTFNWTNHCTHVSHKSYKTHANENATYNAFNIPVESPLYGSRTLLSNPWDSVASPFGWHDVDGVKGADYTTTIGNNVLASEDADADNLPGYSPDGGSSLVFDFPYSPNMIDPKDYVEFAISNLFVANNLMHDIMYRYGFDEPAGNFQYNNYGKSGAGFDEVNADAQDGSGTNNANFSTPPDGSNPRMQMFIWDQSSAGAGTLVVTSPVKSKFTIGKAQFGTFLSPQQITGKLVLVNDGTGANGIKGCNSIKNGTVINGNIAAVERGNCTFVEKVYNAQLAGAIAVVILDTSLADQVITMSGSDSRITIPAVFVKYSDANELMELLLGGNVNIQLYDSSGFVPKTDSDLDFGVIAHEYMHGISNRLTCGPSVSSGLSNAEQMGEGWSDFIGLALTVKKGDVGATPRGIGNWLIGENQNGTGIRNYPYSTNMAKNPHTYRNIQLASSGGRTEVHYVGEVWCTMLWDMFWNLVNKHGFDENIYDGKGGNNIAIHLVTEGMKLQKCNPGFVDGRNAILKADSILYGGENATEIWKAFARRGLGFSAVQGSSYSTSDGSQAFDLPPSLSVSTPENVEFAALFPNPAQNIVNISLLNAYKISEIQISNIAGQIIPAELFVMSDDVWTLNTSDLSEGLFFVTVIADGKSQNLKLQIVR